MERSAKSVRLLPASRARHGTLSSRRCALGLLGLLPAAVGAAGCTGAAPRAPVRLASRIAMPAVQFPPQSTGEPLHVAVAGVISPARTLQAYRGLLAYLGAGTGRATELVQRPTYGEINYLLRTGGAQVGLVCSLAYVTGQREFGLQCLAAPLVNGRPEYFSLLIAGGGHPAQRLAYLKGARFAFTDPLSNSGRLVPTMEVRKLSATPEQFFGRVVYTYSHDNSMIAVADGLVDAAAVDSLVYDALVAERPELARRTRVVARWGPFGIPPVVAPPGGDPAPRAALRRAFLGLGDDEAGRQVLARLRVERFVEVPDAIYDSVRDMARREESEPWP